MPLYEHTFIARADISAQQAQTLAEDFGQLVTENGGEVKKTEYWGLRTLAYRVKKHRKGHYVHFNVEAPATTIAELERNERIHDDVVRYLTVRTEAFDEGPSIIMQTKSGRDERRRDRERG